MDHSVATPAGTFAMKSTTDRASLGLLRCWFYRYLIITSWDQTMTGWACTNFLMKRHSYTYSATLLHKHLISPPKFPAPPQRCSAAVQVRKQCRLLRSYSIFHAVESNYVSLKPNSAWYGCKSRCMQKEYVQLTRAYICEDSFRSHTVSVVALGLFSWWWTVRWDICLELIRKQL